MDLRILGAIASAGSADHNVSWGSGSTLMSDFAKEGNFIAMQNLSAAWSATHPRTLRQMTASVGAWLQQAFLADGVPASLIEAYTKANPGWKAVAQDRLRGARQFPGYVEVLRQELDAFGAGQAQALPGGVNH